MLDFFLGGEGGFSVVLGFLLESLLFRGSCYLFFLWGYLFFGGEACLPSVSDVELIRCFMMSIHPGLGRLGLLLVFLVLFWLQFSVAVSNGLDLGFSQNLVASSVLHMHPHELFF